MSRVIHFEIPASDPERAANFYRKAFGWKIEKWPGPMDYWMVNTGAEGAPGINGGLMKNTQVKTTTNTIGVDSVDAAVKTVQSAGRSNRDRTRVLRLRLDGIGERSHVHIE